MRRTCSVLSVVLLFAWSSPVLAQQTPAPDTRLQDPVVVMAGEGIVRRAPDRAWVTIAAESRARSPQEAQKLNAEAMSAVLARLKGLGLPGEAIQTRGYDLQPEFDFVNNRRTLRGYVVRNTLEVRVDDLMRLGELLDATVGAGATSVSNVRFDLRDRSAAEREALKLAVADARGRATAAAEGAGMRVSHIVRLEEQRYYQVPPRPLMMGREAMAADVATPIEPGELEVRATVVLTAAIRD